MFGSSRKNPEKQPTSAKEENLDMEKIILIEKELMEDSIKESGITEEEWAKKNGGPLRKIFDENPELVELWQQDKEKAKEKIKKLLKKKQYNRGA